ncbi:uncharacterized protein KZ484_008754 [Pholidichthys leucotaenia]
MSQNYPFRRPTSDRDFRSNPGSYGDMDRRQSVADRDFYRPPQDSSSSSRSPQDTVFSLLNSWGLEPDDLSMLAELPEDVLTLDSLPHFLKQIKKKRGTVNPVPPRAPSPPSTSSSRDREQHRQLVQYPLDHIIPPAGASEPERWGTATTRSTMDSDHRPGRSDYGKTAPLRSFSSVGLRERTQSSRFSNAGSADYRSVPPPRPEPPKPQGGGGSSGESAPTRKQAHDFNGATPRMFPYSCSLCDITVLSEQVWQQHVKSTAHAGGQLSLLQRFPGWNGRLERCRESVSQPSKRRDNTKAAMLAQMAAQSQSVKQIPDPRPNKKPKQEVSEKGKVVNVTFPAQSVDEAYLRKLCEPFGKIVEILMFPSMAFVELDTIIQGRELVNYHVNNPPTVNGVEIKFSVSNAFSFLQSNRVITFSPAPQGKDGKSDLISIIKRFGPPLYTLFLPSMVYVEMLAVTDAQKLINYYISNQLKINEESIKVSYSKEYKTLVDVPSAQKYEEGFEFPESSGEETKDGKGDRKTRSKSRDRSKHGSSKTRSRSRDRSKHGSNKTRSRSRDRSRHGSSKTRSRSRDRSSKTRHRSRGRSSTSKTKDDKEERKSGKKSSSGSSVETGSTEKKPDLEEPESKGGSVPAEEPKPAAEEPKPAAVDEELEKETPEPEENSDIKGMEVIGEERENLPEEGQEEVTMEAGVPTEGKESPRKKDGEEVVVKEETEEEEGEEEEKPKGDEALLEEGEDHFIDLDDCIVMDELEESDHVRTTETDGESEGMKTQTPETESDVKMSSEKEPEDKAEEDRVNKGTVETEVSNQQAPEEHLVDPSEIKSKTEDDSPPETKPTQKKRRRAAKSRRKRKGAKGKGPVPSKTQKMEREEDDDDDDEEEEEEMEEVAAAEEEKLSEPKEERDGKETSTEDEAPPSEVKDCEEPEEQPEQVSEASAEVHLQSGPEEGATEPPKPSKPVGAEFVRPVVGYLCNLCQLIFADEDEAKREHCSTATHYSRYQEKTGKDPWAN